jgi:hypothetical protein
MLSYTASANVKFAALDAASGSAITRLNTLEVASGSAINRLSSLETASGSAIARLNSIENKTGSYATTGSNTFAGGQYFSSSFNPTGFTTTASLYTDGGLRVTKDAYISGTLYLNNVTVFGTQSVAYISSSQLNIGTNLITVNTDTPSVRFGGLAVYDSGSTGLTGSMLWDSQNNHWVYSNPSGSSYSGGMFISGPRTAALGSETGTTSCMLLAGQGGDHLTSSMIYHDSTVTCIPNTLIGSTVCGSTSTFSSTSTACNFVTSGNTLFGITLKGRSSDNYGAIGFYSSDGGTRYGYLQSHSTNCGQLIVNGDGGGQAIFDCRGVVLTSVMSGTRGTFTSCLGVGHSPNGYVLDVCGTQRTIGSLTINEDGGGTKVLTVRSDWAGVDPAINVTTNNCLLLMTNNTVRVCLSNTGIATFACQVCSPSSIIKGTINEQLVLDFVIGAGSYTHQSFRLCGANQYRLIGNTNGNFVLRNDVISSDVLTFACAGGATFACSVIAGNVFASYSGTNAGVEFGNSGSGGQFGFLKWDNGSNYLYLGHSYGSAFNRNLVINSSGNVGIGATAPSSLLHICGAGTGAMLRLQNTSTVSGDQGPMIQFMSANQVGGQNFESGYIQSIWTSEGNAFGMRFATKGVDASQSEKMRITSGGLVLIGTSTLGDATGLNDLLTIGKAGSTSTGINFTNGTATRWGFIYINNAKTVYGSFNDIAFESGASATERLRISSTGIACFACQICVPSVISCLNVNSGFTALLICNPNPGSSAFSQISIFNNTSNQSGFFYNSSTRSDDGGVCSFSMYNDSANGNIRIRTGNNIVLATGAPAANRLTITSDGIMSQTQPLGKNFIVLKCITIDSSSTGFASINLADYMSPTFHINMNITAGAYGNSADGAGIFKIAYGGYYGDVAGNFSAIIANCITNGVWGWCRSGTSYCVGLQNTGTQSKFVMVKFDVSYSS